MEWKPIQKNPIWYSVCCKTQTPYDENAAADINDLRIPPGNHLEKLSGNLEGYHSIRINSKWRMLFYWENNNACDVEIVDYH